MCNCKNNTQHLASIGFLCQQCQRPYFDVLRTLTDAGVKPTVVINLVPHYEWHEASRVLDPSVPLPMIEGTDCNG